MAITEAHPRAEELVAFSLGTLGGESHASLETHIADCPECQEKVGAVPADRLIELLKSARSRLNPPADPTDASQAQTPTPLSAKEATVSQMNASVVASRHSLKGSTQVDIGPPDLARHERYRIVREIGIGGMGAVYEAEHRVMQRRVALKVIKADFTASAKAVERFRREVRAAARLTHPNIVATYDAEDAGATQFMVMEYIEGVGLNQLVQDRGPLPVIEACDSIRQAALGLQHAHEHGMVHRDVKPANLIRCADGTVKVLDFGLATLTAQQDDSLTDDNVVMGTPNYMAPEQAESARNADIRADVYSLGCTLYHLLTGDVPYPTGTTMQKILAHRDYPVPSVRAIRPEVSPQLAAVVARMLAKKPDDRYQTPGDVAAALEPFAKPAPVQPARRRRPLVLALAAALLAGIILAGGVVYRIQTDNGVIEIKTQSDDVQVLVKQQGKIVELMDTKTKNKITLRSGIYELELKDALDGLKLDITDATVIREKTVLATIKRLPKDTVPPESTVVRAKTPTTEPEIAVGGMKLLQRVPIKERDDFFSSTAVSSDGDFFAACILEGDRQLAVVWDGKTGKERFRVPGWYLHFTPDGKKLIVNARKQELLVYDLATGKPLGTIGFHAQLFGFSPLPDSRHLFIWIAGLQLRLYDLENGKLKKSWPYETGISAWGNFTDDARVAFVRPAGAKEWVGWDVQKNEPSDVFRQLAKYYYFSLYPGHKQALVQVAAGEKYKVINMADGNATPHPEPKWGGYRGYGIALFDRRIELFGYYGGELRLYDSLSTKLRATFQLPDEGDFGRGNPIAVSPDGRFACTLTDRAVSLLRLPEPVTGK